MRRRKPLPAMVLLQSLITAGSLFVFSIVSGQPTTTTLIDGPGVELVRMKCSLCHDLDHITGIRQTREEWEDTVKIMIRRGAPITSEEMAIIVEYCTRYYGK